MESNRLSFDRLIRLVLQRPATDAELRAAENQDFDFRYQRIQLIAARAKLDWPEVVAEFERIAEPVLTHKAVKLSFLRKAGLAFRPSDLSPMVTEHNSGAILNPPPNAPVGLAIISTSNYLAYAYVTATSFKSHHAHVPVYLLLVDGSELQRQQLADSVFDHVTLSDELEIDDLGWYCAKFNASELSNALKPAFLLHLARYVSKLIYLDSDIAVFGSFDKMLGLLDEEDAKLVLVPHMLEPFPHPERYWNKPQTADIFNSGLINGGAIGLRAEKCEKFLRFWLESNLSAGGFSDETGYQTDQQYLNWALVMEDQIAILRDTSYNVAYWNLHDRGLRLVESGRWQVDGEPLTFFHFSGFDPHDPLRLSKHDHRYSVYNLPSVAEILSWYAERVFNNPFSGTLLESSSYDVFGNGFEGSAFIRRLLKKYEAYLPKYDVREKQQADQLCWRLMLPLSATGSMLPLVASEIYTSRPDLQRAYPNAHSDPTPDAFNRWFVGNAGREYGIEALVASHRSVLLSDSLVGFAEEISKVLSQSNCEQLFLGPGRAKAVALLQQVGRGDLADSLLHGDCEWSYTTDLSAILKIWRERTDLRTTYPEIFGESHDDFLHWLRKHSHDEHAISFPAIEVFSTKTWQRVLARIFSFLSRREDLAEIAVNELLTPWSDKLFRELIRVSGEGLEYDLADVEVLMHLHRNARYVLVPMYLELPAIRRRAISARVPGNAVHAFPSEVRTEAWLLKGIALHASFFDIFDAFMDDEVKKDSERLSKPARHVFDVLRAEAGSLGNNINEQLRGAAHRAAHRLRAIKEKDVLSGKDKIVISEGSQQVNVFGFFFADTGVGESARGLAEAMSVLRPIRAVPITTGHLQEHVELDQLFQRYQHWSNTNVIVSYPHQHEDFFGILPPEYMRRRRNVIHLAWEQKDSNQYWKKVYDRYDEIWAISDFAAGPFRKLFGDRVKVVPNVLSAARYPDCTVECEERSSRSRFRFLFIFDANSSIERKNPEGVLDAFIKAFGGRPGTSVQLYMKVGNRDRPEHSSRLKSLAQRAKKSGLDVVFDGRALSRAEVMKLVASSHCYVSLHRAEGFGYTLAEAMFYAVPVIATGYSGNLQFMSSADSYLVPAREVLVTKADGPFQRGSLWGEPDLDAAASMMRDVVDNPASAALIGLAGQIAVRKSLSPQGVAEHLRGTLL